MSNIDLKKHAVETGVRNLYQRYIEEHNNRSEILCGENCKERSTACNKCLEKFDRWKAENGRG